MFKKPFNYRLLKDGKPVYEQISYPLFAQFLLTELKPEHTWTIEEIEHAPKKPLEPMIIYGLQCENCGAENDYELSEEDLTNWGLERET